MTPLQWARECIAFLEKNRPKRDYYADYQPILCGLHERMCRAPASVVNEFEHLEEAEIDENARVWRPKLLTGTLPEFSHWLSVEALTLQIAGLIRACDAAIEETRYHFGRSGDVEQWKVGDWWMIPRKGPVAFNTPGLGQFYQRRGLRYNRLIKRSVNGLEVVVTEFDSPRENPGKARQRNGVASFKSVDLQLDQSNPKGFIVRGAKIKQVNSALQLHLAKLTGEDLFGAIWPELTVPPRSRKKIAKHLAANTNTAPEVTVAGSWHEKNGTITENISHIFDRFGNSRIKHKKFTQYRDATIKRELVSVGGQLHVVATDEFLVSFAICKDFCGMNGLNPYLDIGVDLVFVPSFSNASAFRAHQAVAKSIRHPVGTRTILVQQFDNVSSGKHAVALDPSQDPTKGAIYFEGEEIWKTFETL